MFALTTSITFGRSVRLAAVAAFAALTLATPASFAQTPIAGDSASHPAHIHSGSCPEPGDVVLPLENLTDLSATGEVVGSDAVVATVSSRTVVDAPLSDILATDHAVNVHLSDDDMGTYIACGNIGGVLTPNEEEGDGLIVGLAEQNDSGWAGVAWLAEMGDQTEVVVILVQLEDAS